jgi:hypothetical protein
VRVAQGGRIVRHAYDALLRLYPESFRRRYGAEMSLDFADGWADARMGGPMARVGFASRVAGDLAVSLVREWTRGAHLVIMAAAAVITLLLWGVALRPWAWKWDLRPGPPLRTPVADITEGQLLMLAAGALIPVIVELLFATRMVKRR